MKRIYLFCIFLLIVPFLFSSGCGKSKAKEASLHFRNASNAVKNQNYDEAIKEYKASLGFMPEHTLAHFNLAYVLENYKIDFDEAILHYNKVLELEPKRYSFLHKNIGNLYYKKGEYDKAIDEYLKALKTIPNDSITHNDLGAAYLKKDQPDKAIEEFKEAATLDPLDSTPHSNMAYVYREKGMEQKAIEEEATANLLKSQHP